MTIITKGMGAIIKGGRKKLSTSQASKVSAIKDKLIKKIKSAKHKAYVKKFGKTPTVTIKYPGGKKEKVVDQMIGEDEIQRYSKILNAKTWRKRK
jgi:hypothetical protein